MSDKVIYTCEACSVEIQGWSSDPQEAPKLFCPDCGQEMELEVEWNHA